MNIIVKNCTFSHTQKSMIILALLCVSINPLFSQSQDVFFFHWDLGTAAVIYGDDTVNSENTIVRAQDTGRFIISADVGLGVDLDKRVRLLTGALSVFDLAVNKKATANRIDYGFFTGVRIYPQVAGFNFGVDYVLGTRSDFIKLPGQSSTALSSTHWGNGYRLNIGYDFSYHGWRFAPNIEGSYRMMPRGGSQDHYFSIFLNFNIFP